MAPGAACKCGRSLALGIEVASGKCWACSKEIHRPPISEMPADTILVEGGSVTKQSSVTGSVTKQAKYRAKNADKTRQDSATRMARWRDGQRRRRE